MTEHGGAGPDRYGFAVLLQDDAQGAQVDFADRHGLTAKNKA